MKPVVLYSLPKKITSFSILLLLFVSITSCIKTDTSDEAGYIVIINAGETTAPQDFYLDNTKINNSGIAYGQTLGYAYTSVGTHQLQFKTTANSILDGAGVLDVFNGGYYSVFYTDDKTTVTAIDDRTAPQSSKARVRLINLSEA